MASLSNNKKYQVKGDNQIYNEREITFHKMELEFWNKWSTKRKTKQTKNCDTNVLNTIF